MTEETKKKIQVIALENFQDTTGLKARCLDNLRTDPGIHDGILEIKSGDVVKKFAVQVKTRITRPIISMMTEQIAKQGAKYLLMTDYVAPQMADLLKQNDIAFMDAAGNTYINDPPLFLFIKGNKRPDGFETAPVKRAFKAGGLRIIFALLCKPDLIERPFREIAEHAGVALGTVAGIVNELKGMGYVLDMGERGRKLVNKEGLIKRWVIAYPEQLRPKLHIGKFQAEQKGWWLKAGLEGQGCWGGEAAGAILTGYLKPKRITIYIKKTAGKIVLKNRLVKNPNGDVEILKAFWNVETGWNNRNTVHPILVYADLMATSDPRDIETAEMVYEKEIARLIRKD